jgi:glycosyltransferase involved in cell wall biosynthesis
MSSKQFSVVVTCHNQRPFIRDAVESALSQPNYLREVIVVDDGSTDGSVEVLQEYADFLRLVVLPVNRGAIEARNRGAALATGGYLVFLDGDDLLQPFALTVYDRVIVARHPEIIAAQPLYFEGAVPPRCGRMPGEVRFVQYGHFMAKDRPWGLYASTWVVKRQGFQRVGGWSSGIFHLDLVDQATKLGHSGRAILIQSPRTALYRLHADNSIHNVPPFLRMMHQIIRKELAGDYGGRQHRLERCAWLGGPILFWIKRAVCVGLYGDALRLFFSGWWMIWLGAIRRMLLWFRRSPLESLALGEGRGDAICKNPNKPVIAS